MRSAYAHAQGHRMTRGGQLPFELFDAVAMSEEEAQYVQTDVNIERLLQEAREEARR